MKTKLYKKSKPKDLRYFVTDVQSGFSETDIQFVSQYDEREAIAALLSDHTKECFVRHQEGEYN
jgi:hypothetical protein